MSRSPVHGPVFATGSTPTSRASGCFATSPPPARRGTPWDAPTASCTAARAWLRPSSGGTGAAPTSILSSGSSSPTPRLLADRERRSAEDRARHAIPCQQEAADPPRRGRRRPRRGHRRRAPRRAPGGPGRPHRRRSPKREAGARRPHGRASRSSRRRRRPPSRPTGCDRSRRPASRRPGPGHRQHRRVVADGGRRRATRRLTGHPGEPPLRAHPPSGTDRRDSQHRTVAHGRRQLRRWRRGRRRPVRRRRLPRRRHARPAGIVSRPAVDPEVPTGRNHAGHGRQPVQPQRAAAARPRAGGDRRRVDVPAGRHPARWATGATGRGAQPRVQRRRAIPRRRVRGLSGTIPTSRRPAPSPSGTSRRPSSRCADSTPPRWSRRRLVVASAPTARSCTPASSGRRAVVGPRRGDGRTGRAPSTSHTSAERSAPTAPSSPWPTAATSCCSTRPRSPSSGASRARPT